VSPPKEGAERLEPMALGARQLPLYEDYDRGRPKTFLTGMLSYLLKKDESASSFYFMSFSTISRAIQTPHALACAKPRVIPAPSPPTYNPEISVSNRSFSFGRAE